MIKEAIAKVVSKRDLTEPEMEEAMEEIMTGKATSAQIGAFITALRMKGETADEITGAARVMRAKAKKININNHLLKPALISRLRNSSLHSLTASSLLLAVVLKSFISSMILCSSLRSDPDLSSLIVTSILSGMLFSS